MCHVLWGTVHLLTLDSWNRQETQEERNMTYVQPYHGEIRDVSQVWAIKDTSVREGFWSSVQMVLG